MLTFGSYMGFSVNAFIYKNVIDRILAGVQKSLIAGLEPGDRVLDVACGTGSLSLAMAEKVKEVSGIDLNEEMIELASAQAVKTGVANVSFGLKDAAHLSVYGDKHFDVALTSMAIHQFDPGLAVSILKEMGRIAGRVIVMDYNHPIKPGFAQTVIWLIERIAGGDHYANFSKYRANGGLAYYTDRAGIKQPKKILYNSNSFIVAEYVPG